MTKLDENLSKIFDVEPLKELVKIDATPVTVIDDVQNNPDDIDMEADFKELRENTKDLLTKGKIALDCALDIVQQSDQPRAIEVFSTLLGQLSKINQEALDLHDKRRKIKNTKQENGSKETNITNNNAIFVGSTAELNKMISSLTGKKSDAP